MSDRYKDTPIEDPKRYFRPNMATDAVVFAILNTDYTNKDLYSGELHVLLIKRDAVQSSGKDTMYENQILFFVQFAADISYSIATFLDISQGTLQETTVFR